MLTATADRSWCPPLFADDIAQQNSEIEIEGAVFRSETDRRWEPAETLDPVDALTSSNGERVDVVGISTDSYWATAYNLTVDDIHTY